MELFKGVRGSEMLPPNAHFAYLNTLIPDNETDLLHGIKIAAKITKRNKPKNFWIPVLAAFAAVLICIIGVLLFLVINVSRDVRELNYYFNDPQVIRDKEELAHLHREISIYSTAYTNANQQITEDEERPHLTRQLIETIVNTGGATVSVNGFTFRDSDGAVRVNATATNEFAAGNYVERLRNNNTIEYVLYLGYTSDAAGTFSFSFEVKAN